MSGKEGGWINPGKIVPEQEQSDGSHLLPSDSPRSSSHDRCPQDYRCSSDRPEACPDNENFETLRL
eukprot:746178-Hanusia_phi.AAC.3